MRRHGQTSRELELFDLPLAVDPEIAEEADREIKRGVGRKAPEPAVGAEQIDLLAATENEAAPREQPEERPRAPHIRRRYLAGVFDAGISAVAFATLVVGTAEIGGLVRTADWPAYLFVVLEFSFLYVVFSVTFWGRTPGMARARLIVRGRNGQAATLGQAARRWLGGVLTVALLGLPTLLALGGRGSLADLLSGSRLARLRP